MQRLKNRAQYEAAMAGGTVSRTPHFVLHRAPLAASSDPSQAPASTTGATGAGPVSEESRARPRRAKVLFPVVDDTWMGAVVPKRWAKRAVTRNGIRRQIYDVSESFAARLPAAAHVVRLRTDFARKQFPSAWSEALKSAVRGELLQLFERVAARAVTLASPSVTPAQAGAQSGRAAAVDPRLRGDDGVAHGDDGVAHGDDGVAHGDDGVAHADDEPARADDETARADSERKAP
ncbi:ribonuclease P protein component [Ramlibacter alkalitolerans]|uniref:Ribonuclease P protein component n=1 Tax=Ramlibacter alkalitolerans TaxID=2039631 RepID=A0ABS1JMZ9_9BURK|nr:ribonuclease P protein component [Ramlibacter alkalitolerans]